MSAVSFHVVVGPSLLDGTAPVGGPNGGQVLQRGQTDNSLVRVPSYACTAIDMSRVPMDRRQAKKQRRLQLCETSAEEALAESPGNSKPRRDLHLKAEW